MENQSLLHSPDRDPSTRKDGRISLLSLRRQQTEVPFPEVFEEPGLGLLGEYFHIFRRRKRNLILIFFLGFFASLLVTLPQTRIYQARGSIEIQNYNDNFLNLRNVTPTADDAGSSPPQFDVQTQAGILQSESSSNGLLQSWIWKKSCSQKSEVAAFQLGAKAWVPGGSTDSPPRKGPDPGYQEPESQHSAQHAAHRNPLRFYRPALAADFVNTLTAEFIQQNLESHWKTTQQTGEWLTHQMEDVRIKLEKSEDKLQNYAKILVCCLLPKKTTLPRKSSASFRRSSPRLRRIASPGNRHTSWCPLRLPNPFPKYSMMQPSRTTRSSSPIFAASLPSFRLP